MEKNNKSAFLFTTHKIDDTILARFNILKQSIKDLGDLFLLINKENEDEIDLPENIIPYIFNTETLKNLGYTPIEKTIIPGSNHFAVLQFYRDYPYYNYYWSIEFDVVFTGNWGLFFSSFAHINADFISSNINRYSDVPSWYWWNTLNLIDLKIPQADYVKSFNPIYRISPKALQLLDSFLIKGNKGHHEVLIPTILNFYGLKIIDFGGKGEFVLDGFENKFYITSDIPSDYQQRGGTMRFRPLFRDNDLKLDNKLYHPLKSNIKEEGKIILTFIFTDNGAKSIKDCLSSIKSSLFKSTIFVIDNASDDETCCIIRKDFPDVLLVKNKIKSGFNEAVNFALNYAKHNDFDFVLILNQDVIISRNLIVEIIDAHNSDYRYGILSLLLLKKEAKPYDINIYRYKTTGSIDYIRDLIKHKEVQPAYVAGFINSAAWSITIKCFKKVGELINSDFKDYYNRCSFNGYKIGLSAYANAYYRINKQESETFQNKKKTYVLLYHLVG